MAVRGLLQLVTLVLALASSSGSAAGSLGGSSSVSAEDKHDCRMVSLDELREQHGFSNAEIFRKCNPVCPLPKAADVRTTCESTHHSFHSAVSVFRDSQLYHHQMQWCACMPLPQRAVCWARHAAWRGAAERAPSARALPGTYSLSAACFCLVHSFAWPCRLGFPTRPSSSSRAR